MKKITPQAEQCGWLKDKYGVSWQIVPSPMGELMGDPPERRARVVKAFLKMKKFDIEALRHAYDNRLTSTPASALFFGK